MNYILPSTEFTKQLMLKNIANFRIKILALISVMWVILLSLALLSTISSSIIAQDENVCLVYSLSGPIRGHLVTSNSGKQVCAFFGIPYAKPPVGDLRFKRPVPVDNWQSVLNATVLPDMCTQNITFPGEGLGRKAPEISEDCLYLNIWAPLAIFNSSSRAASVMVWIHGGGFLGGSISEPLINNPILSGEHDIIVAFMQYRVGPLGSIYFGTADAPGNVGIIDQNLAMKWIYDNIGEFGGNKDETTLFGQSAGSWSVAYHTLSPLSKNYFKRAILQSGTANANFIWRSQESAIEFAYEVAEHVGCYSPGENPPKEIDEIIACMRTKDKFLINYSDYVPKHFSDYQVTLTVDNYFMTDSPENLLKDPANSQVDILLGSNSDEGSSILTVRYPEIFNPAVHPSFTIGEHNALIRLMFANLPTYQQDAIVTHYTHWENFNDGYANAQEIARLAGDFAFVCPALDWALKWSNNGRKVYSYWFTHTKENSPVCSDWMGSCHGAELEYTFGMPLKHPSAPENEKNLSRNMQELWVNFAKTGTPLPNWLDFSSSRPVYLNLNGTVISDSSPDNVFGPRPIDCTFWNIELPRLRQLAENKNRKHE